MYLTAKLFQSGFTVRIKNGYCSYSSDSNSIAQLIYNKNHRFSKKIKKKIIVFSSTSLFYVFNLQTHKLQYWALIILVLLTSNIHSCHAVINQCFSVPSHTLETVVSSFMSNPRIFSFSVYLTNSNITGSWHRYLVCESLQM